MFNGLLAAGKAAFFVLELPFKGIEAVRGAVRGKKLVLGDARWSTWSDARKSKYLGGEGLIIGQVSGKLLRLAEPWHVISYGASGSGKTAGLIVPNVLANWGQVNIVFDPKGREVERTTRAYLESRGVRVVCLDPTEPYRSAVYNPLTYLQRCDGYDYAAELRGVVQEVVPNGDPREEHFNRLAQMIGAGVLDDVLRDGGDSYGIGEVSERLLTQRPEQLRLYMEGLAAGGSVQARAAAQAYNTAGDKEKGSHFTTLAKRFELWLDKGVQEVSSGKGIDWQEIFTSGQHTTVFIQPPANLMDYYGAWARVVIGCALSEAQRIYRQRGEPLQQRVCFLIDEAWALGQSARIENAIRTVRAANIQIVMCFQSPSQLKEIYNNAGSVQDSCDVWQVSGGEKNADLLRQASDLVGDTTVQTLSENKSEGGSSESKSETARRLIKPEEIRGMDKYEQLVFVGSLVFKDKKPYWRHIKGLAAGVEKAGLKALTKAAAG